MTLCLCVCACVMSRAMMQREPVFLGPPQRAGPAGQGGASVLRQYDGEPGEAMREDMLAWLLSAAAEVPPSASL
jgi:hypothetical protein